MALQIYDNHTFAFRACFLFFAFNSLTSLAVSSAFLSRSARLHVDEELFRRAFSKSITGQQHW